MGMMPKPGKQLGIAPDPCLGLYSFLVNELLLASASLGSVLKLAPPAEGRLVSDVHCGAPGLLDPSEVIPVCV